MGQALGRLRRTDTKARVVIVPMVAAQIREEPPPGREHAREGFPVKALGMQLRDEPTNLRWLQLP